MDGARFDDLFRILASGLSRRATLAALANGFIGAGVLALRGDDAEARKKRKRKKKNKKCKSGAKKCGKQCIPRSACCGDCPGDKLGGTPCGESGDCGPDQTCSDGNCICPNPIDIACGALCCDSNIQVCEFGNTGATCIDSPFGACPASDFCNASTFYACVNGGSPYENCVCASTADPDPGIACVIFQFTQQPAANCTPCANSTECPGGFCIPGNASGAGYCGCNNNFCVPACPEAP